MSHALSLAAEWERHRATWLAWPSDAALWGRHLEPARAEFLQLCRAIAAGEQLEILVRSSEEASEVNDRLSALAPRVHECLYWDIWLRDTAPLFALDGKGRPTALCFRFNGWGEKYHFSEDDGLAERIAQLAGTPSCDVPLTCEGGALDFDGDGSFLTTSTCVLNANRNPQTSREDVEALLASRCSADHVIWLEGQLAGDHTDGHVDTLARWLRPGVVACMEAVAADDPNRGVLERVAAQLASARDRGVHRFDVVKLPAPGLVPDDDGSPMAASYLNIYIKINSPTIYGGHGIMVIF